jgi:hypothetical protein
MCKRLGVRFRPLAEVADKQIALKWSHKSPGRALSRGSVGVRSGNLRRFTPQKGAFHPHIGQICRLGGRPFAVYPLNGRGAPFVVTMVTVLLQEPLFLKVFEFLLLGHAPKRVRQKGGCPSGGRTSESC